MFNKILPSNVLYLLANTMKNKLSDTVRTIPKSNRKILERGKIDTPDSHIYTMYDHSISWPGTETK